MNNDAPAAEKTPTTSRRDFLKMTAMGLGGLAFFSLLKGGTKEGISKDTGLIMFGRPNEEIWQVSRQAITQAVETIAPWDRRSGFALN